LIKRTHTQHPFWQGAEMSERAIQCHHLNNFHDQLAASLSAPRVLEMKNNAQKYLFKKLNDALFEWMEHTC
jgi:hypothetical protein